MSRIDLGFDIGGFGAGGKTLLKPDDQLQLAEAVRNTLNIAVYDQM